MSKKVIIVHGWEGSPHELMIKNMGIALQKEGFEVIIPEMPDNEHPKITPWVNKLEEVSGKLDKDTYFIGHSIGCQTILRFLEKSETEIGGVVLIAPWLKLNEKNLESLEEKRIAKPWLRLPINFSQVKPVTNNFFCIFSDNDPYVLMSNKDLFQKNLGARSIVEHHKGHYTTSDGVTDNTTAVEEILKLSKN